MRKKYAIWFDDIDKETLFFSTRKARRKALFRLFRSRKNRELWEQGKIRILDLGTRSPEEEWYDYELIKAEWYFKDYDA